jgi:hypothetical protein
VDDLITARGAEIFEQLLDQKKAIGENTEEEAKTLGVTDQLIAIGQERVNLWHTSKGIAYGDVVTEGVRATYCLQSEIFSKWLRHEFHVLKGASCGKDTLKTAIETLASLAEFDGQEREIFSRVGKFGDRYYLDLGTPDWSAIEYSAVGWEIVTDPPVRFERARKGCPLPMPVRGGDLLELFSFINAESEDYPLLTGFLMKCLIPDGTEPLLILHGEQGTGKSSGAEVLKRIVDPSVPNMLKSVADTRTVAIYAQKTRVLLYDNLSYISAETSDLMCSMATGGGHVERAMYSNNELIEWSFKRPQILTGIDEIASRGDLLDRSLMVELSPILGGHYRAESDYWEDFKAAHPKLLGALLNTVCVALDMKKKIPKPVGSRMVEFAHIAAAADVYLGYGDGAFMKRLLENKKRGHEVAIESSSVAIAISQLVDDSPDNHYQDCADNLLNELNKRVSEDTRKKGWPTDTKRLGKEIARISPCLRAQGITVNKTRTANQRLYSFTKNSMNQK